MSRDSKSWLRAQTVPPGADCDCEGGEQYIEGLLAAARDSRTSDGISPADLERAVWHIQFHVEDEARNFANSVSKREAMLTSLPQLFLDFVPAFVEGSDAVAYFWAGLGGLGAYPELQFAYLDSMGAFLSSEHPGLQRSALQGLARCRLLAERTAMLDDYLMRNDLADSERELALAIRDGRAGRIL